MFDHIDIKDDAAFATLQRRLNAYNRTRLNPGTPSANWRDDIVNQAEMALDEGDFLESQRLEIADAAAAAPRDAAGFITWFEELEKSGPGQHDPLFPWLAEEATLEQMKWFLTQEVAGEAGFEDLTAVAQLRLPTRPKLEMARNYWDEMGRGNSKGMHGPLLEALSHKLDLQPDAATIAPESLALANTMAGLALNRRYAYHAIGALGAIELTAPARAGLVNVGLKRLGVAARDRHYFSLHAVLDVRHSQAWNSEVLYPLVESDPSVAVSLAEGALMRLARGAACFARYRAELWS